MRDLANATSCGGLIDKKPLDENICDDNHVLFAFVFRDCNCIVVWFRLWSFQTRGNFFYIPITEMCMASFGREIMCFIIQQNFVYI